MKDRNKIGRSRKYCIVFFWVTYFSIMLNVSALGATSAIGVSSDGHWLEFKGKRVLLVGDSVTQGWHELGTDFDQKAYVDALAARGINVLMLWSYIGIVDQESDPRIGYDAPEVWPWKSTGDTFDLSRFTNAYFVRLRNLVEYANNKNIVVIIIVHDGWTKTRFTGHPFNMVNGGPLTDRSEYVELADYNNEMPSTFSPAWNQRQKHQYFLEGFCDRLIQATGDQPNVMYEIFNEGNWYNQTDLRAFQVHFLEFFKARTARPTLVNDDHVGGPDFHGELNADIISVHRPTWNFQTSVTEAFTHFASMFGRSPPKPYFFSEPVPGFTGNSPFSIRSSRLFGLPTEYDGIMRLMWGTALGGAGFVIQNDTSFSFDPKAAIHRKVGDRDRVLDLEGHISRFFNDSGVNIATMTPNGGLASTGVVLAKPNSEYVVYSQSGASFTMDLSGSTRNFTARFYSPRTGEFQPKFSVPGGSASHSITKPDSRDWVLHLGSER